MEQSILNKNPFSDDLLMISYFSIIKSNEKNNDIFLNSNLFQCIIKHFELS